MLCVSLLTCSYTKRLAAQLLWNQTCTSVLLICTGHCPSGTDPHEGVGRPVYFLERTDFAIWLYLYISWVKVQALLVVCWLVLADFAWFLWSRLQLWASEVVNRGPKAGVFVFPAGLLSIIAFLGDNGSTLLRKSLDDFVLLDVRTSGKVLLKWKLHIGCVCILYLNMSNALYEELLLASP